MKIDIENIFPKGFDYKSHSDNLNRKEWGNIELIADIYHCTGNELFQIGRFDEAIANYSEALKLNPHYKEARLNRGITLAHLGKTNEAGIELADSEDFP